MNKKVVIVTGWSGGIGSALCAVLETNNYDVYCFQDDVSQRVSWVWNQRVGYPKKFKIDDLYAIVHCAGIADAKQIHNVTKTDMMRMMEVNCLPLLWSIQIFGVEMELNNRDKNSHSHIITISSISSLLGSSYLAHYCASKFAVNGLMQVAAKELAKHKIMVNNVCPGPTDTPMWSMLEKQYGEIESHKVDYLSKQLVKRLGEPRDTVDAVMYLLRSSFITGTNINVSGGQILG
jgi:meso-butanediol dehydrogenase/(S,S)-butanediol dehydrogenase/diacetyl reductase